MRHHLVFLLSIGCATAGRDPAVGTGGTPPGLDASPAVGCTMMTTDLLMNGSFDTMPAGSGWSSTPANPMYPIITSNGVTPQSAPDKAWMGSVISATDDMHEDIAIPASATSLVLAGYYQVRTMETGTAANDTGKVDLATTGGTSLETALSVDSAHATTAWTAFSYPITSNVAGQTIRLRFTTVNNSTKPTSFYFDTVSLQATYCQ